MAVIEYTKGVATQISEHFKSTEFDCSCSKFCTKTKIDTDLVEYLERLYFQMGASSITINSGYRCKDYNDSLPNAAEKSQHIEGKAADIVVKVNGSTVSQNKVAQYAETLGIPGIGRDSTYVHVDTRSTPYWYYYAGGKNWPQVSTFFGKNDPKITLKEEPQWTTVSGGGTQVETTIWSFFKSKGFTNAGIAGLMGNLYYESKLSSKNLQEDFEESLGYTDDTYTTAVIAGTYSGFTTDGAGYGLAQWTESGRKTNLLNYANQQNKNIDDLDMQLNFLYHELTTVALYQSVLTTLQTSNSIRACSDKVLLEFESPKNKGESVQIERANKAQEYYNRLLNTAAASKPITINITNKTNTNNTTESASREIKYIVVHYTAGINSRAGQAINTANYFATSTREASADFIVDDDTIVQYNPDINNRYTWHCGGAKETQYGGTFYQRCTNTNSIGIEICSTNEKNRVDEPNNKNWKFTDAVLDRAIMLIQFLMQTYSVSLENVIRHFDVTGKPCPGIVGWNSMSGDESKWAEFKARLSVPPPVSRDAYAATPNILHGETLNCYNAADDASGVVTTYKKGDVFPILEQHNGWGKTNRGWVYLNHIKKISASEAVITSLVNGYDKLTYDSLTGQILFPMDSWLKASGGGLKEFVSDDMLANILLIKNTEIPNNAEGLAFEAYINNLITALESQHTTANELEQKFRLVLKTAATSNKILQTEEFDILVHANDHAFAKEVTEEQILEVLSDKKQDVIDYFQDKYNSHDGWAKQIADSPETLNFWFDFMDTSSEMGKYAAKAIGHRPKAVNNDKVKAIYFQETPSVLFLTPEQFTEMHTNREAFNDMNAYTFIKLLPFMENYFTISSQGVSAKDELDSLLNQHICMSNSTTLTSVPIYHLQPNSRIHINDNNTGINGEYIVNKITIPLQYNGTSSITTTKVAEKIY